MRTKPLLPSSKQLIPIIKTHIIKSTNPNTLLSSQTNTPHFTFTLYNQMIQNPKTHNHFTFQLALKTCISTHSFSKAHEIHAHVIKTGHYSYTYLQNTFIYVYVMQYDIVSAHRAFETVVKRDVVTWTSIVSGFVKCGFYGKGVEMFCLMDVVPNENSLVSVLSACCGLRELKLGMSVHCFWLRNYEYGNVIVENALLNFYTKVGSLENACCVFEGMGVRDVVSWSTMIGGFVHGGFCERAVGVFDEMVKRGEVKPNEATVVSVVAACASLGLLSLCELVHSYIEKRRDIPIEGNVGNALVNMYVKCGSMRKAISVFKKLRFKDLVSWSTMISGAAMNGLGHCALPLFGLMLVHGVEPDDVTFISLLTACSHSGLVDEGLMLFKAMVNTYEIKAHEKHYACVVDLYARAGRFIEAEDFVTSMCIEPDGPIWGALVSACRFHGNEVMLERINRVLVEKGANGGTLALVSNSYAGSNRWDESMEVRNVMNCSGLKKLAGRSWVELDE